jgi:protein involved in polysaccharide export with SLBB domain
MFRRPQSDLRQRLRVPTRLVVCCGLALAFGNAGCSISPGDPMGDVAAKINETLRADSGLLVPGDVLDIRFGDLVADTKQWNHEVLVRADGAAAFLGIGDRPVSGLTIESVRASLRAEYQKLLGLRSTEKFSVLLKTKVPRTVIVMGEVHTPGIMTLDGARMTLVEAIGKAGGPMKATARLDKTYLVRWDPETRRQSVWTINAELENWSSPEPIYLQPFDVVFIPNTPIDKLDIWVDQYIRLLLPVPYNTGWTPYTQTTH